MKTINNNSFRKLNPSQLNDTKGGYIVMITLPNGDKVRVRV